MNAILYGNCDELMYIEVRIRHVPLYNSHTDNITLKDPTMMTVDATVMKKESTTGSGWECGMPAYCNWREDPYP